ncbi:MAG TPA: adenosylcobinamide-GDP ribazoletransferase [Candidatus Avacidaminococcus intestinavium]|uniref:Adenosylcobinamide-GDP ribazoletransferase n=1 Tax=Candidatus Avacidaminococcus intestinavium TaxID=2840684 RepID=A0A9D1SLC2_9FIRM|nr:adenosylcobinamide-GDP ribazoletransferase [Candidatus Avacidaminococcus intestinavium]
MRDFITCLEFLTRIRFSGRTDWRDEDFSRSVPYFPLIGVIIGVFLGWANYCFSYLGISDFLRAVLLLVTELIVIGGLMYDGYMDTADGVFSARNRERMLEIMKDSHVGSNAVLAVIILLLLKIAVYLELPSDQLTIALIAAATATRTFMVIFIVKFPYARKTGIGHLFVKYAKPIYVVIAFALCIAILMFLGLEMLVTAGLTLLVMLALASYFTKILGGLTGDTYGALTECGYVCFLVILIILEQVIDKWLI